MALETQIVSLPLGAKLDESFDSKMLDARTSVGECKNVIFKKDGRAEKAPGYTAETAECVAGGRALTAYLLRMHSICSNGTDVLVGGCGIDSSFGSYGEEYYNASVRGAANGAGNYTYNRIGKWFPIRQRKVMAANNREMATDPDSAHVAGTVPSVWTAWIENGAVKMATNRASDGVALTAPDQWTLTGMTSGMERVRIMSLGAYVHVYASSKTDLRKAVFDASSYATGGTKASASVHTLCGKAWHTFVSANYDATLEAHSTGWEGNFISVQLVNDSPPAGGVIITVTPVVYGYAVVIHFETGVSTRALVNTAIAALAGANDVIDVKVAGVQAGFMGAADNVTITLTKGRYSWDATKIVVAAVDVAIVAYCESTASQLELTSYAADGAAGAYGPTAFALYPGSAMALCKCHLTHAGAGVEGLIVVYEAAEGANVNKVCIHTHAIDATFTEVLAETAFFTCAAGFSSLTNITICPEYVTTLQEAAPCSGLAVWAEFCEDLTTPVNTWRHAVRGFVLNTTTGALKRDGLRCAFNHRLHTRAAAWDLRSHVWMCHESATWPVSSLMCFGDLITPYRAIDTEATWLRAKAVCPGYDVDGAGEMAYGAGLGSITSDGLTAPAATYWWPSVCSETQDALAVRLSRFDFLATGLRDARQGAGRTLGGGQLMNFEPGIFRARGFAYPPEIGSVTSAYSEATYTNALQGSARYKYLAIYEYLDRNGELHQSAPSVPVEITTAGNPYLTGQTLTIDGSNDNLDFTVAESFGPSSAACAVTIPHGTYESWDALGQAISVAMMAAIRTSALAAYSLGCSLYVWKDVCPFEDAELQGLIGEMDPAVMKIVFVNPGDTGCYLFSEEWSTSTLGSAIGFGAADIGSSLIMKSWEDLLGAAYQTVQVSFMSGLDSLDIPESTTAAAATIKVRDLIPGDYARNMGQIQIAIYRTEANGTTYHKVASVTQLLAMYESTVLDIMSDSEALTKPLAYTTGEPGDVLENTTPVGIVLESHRDRLLCVDEEDPQYVYASKPKVEGFPAEFTEFIKVQIPGDVLALRSAGEVWLAFTDSACYAIHGQGPDATGQGEFAAPRLVANAGVDSHRGVGTMGDLVVWHSMSRGLWAMDRGYQTQEIGKPILDTLLGHTVNAMIDRADERRIEVELSSGYGAWYDQRFDRWTTQTNFSGLVAGCNHQGNSWHVMGSQVCYQGATTWTRGGTAHAMSVRTAWIRVGAMTGLQRVRWENIIGDWRDAHTIRVQRWIDYVIYAVDSDRSVVMATDPGWALSPYLLKHHPKTQKCSAIRLEISDVPPAGVGCAGFRLTALDLECGVKRGSMHRGKVR